MDISVTGTAICSTTTLVVESTEKPNIIRMIWHQNIASEDVITVFAAITSVLDKAAQPVHIVVDLREKPKFPIQTTISETLKGPFNHPKMGKWLVLGSNRPAKLIADVLTKVSRRNDIIWFEKEDELSAYAANLN